MSRDLVIAPTAGALVRAVQRESAEEVAVILDEIHDWHALAVVLAANVGRVRADFLPHMYAQSKNRRRMSCEGCGRLCRTTSGLCGDCRLTDASPVVLEGGAWVPRGGVLVWREAS